MAHADGGRFGLALVNPLSLTGREVSRLLSERRFPAARVKLLDVDGRAGQVGEYDGEALLVQATEPESFAGVDFALFCGSPHAEEIFEWSAAAGAVAIDLSGALAARNDVPLVSPTVHSPESTDGARRVAVPHPVAFTLGSVLAPLERAVGVDSVEAVAFQPASDFDVAGIDELQAQTVALLNFKPSPEEALGGRAAFNLLPRFALGRDAASAEELWARQTERILGWPLGRVALRAVVVPVFHCHCVAVFLAVSRPTPVEQLEEALREAGVHLVETRATPAELAGEEGVHVGGLRSARPGGTDYCLWVVCDNLVAGAALEAVRVAEQLVAARG